MLKIQIALITILIASVAFVSCDRAQKMLEPVADDMTDMMPADDTMATDDMMTDMMKMMDSSMYMSWAHVALPAPAPMAEATSPIETGAAHNPAHVATGITTPRTVYINEIGAMANKAGTAYPAGTIIVKEIMDDTETFVDKVAMMMKSDDPMYAGHNGWAYKKYLRPSADGEYMQVKGSNLEDAAVGCHGCHAKADNDSVFVSLSMPETPEMPEMPETPEMPEGAGETPEMPEMPEMPEGAGETPEMPEMPETDAGNGDDTGDANDDDANTDAGNGDDTDDANGDGDA